MHFFKTYDKLHFRKIREITELLSKVWKIFITSLILAYW